MPYLGFISYGGIYVSILFQHFQHLLSVKPYFGAQLLFRNDAPTLR